MAYLPNEMMVEIFSHMSLSDKMTLGCKVEELQPLLSVSTKSICGNLKSNSDVEKVERASQNIHNLELKCQQSQDFSMVPIIRTCNNVIGSTSRFINLEFKKPTLRRPKSSIIDKMEPLPLRRPKRNYLQQETASSLTVPSSTRHIKIENSCDAISLMSSGELNQLECLHLALREENEDCIGTFLESPMPKLRKLNINFDITNERALANIFNSSCLSHLTLKGKATAQMLHKICKVGSLEYLKMSLANDNQLVEFCSSMNFIKMRNLKSFTVTVKSKENFYVLSNTIWKCMPNLEKLFIQFVEEPPLDDIEQLLMKLDQLSKFTLCVKHYQRDGLKIDFETMKQHFSLRPIEIQFCYRQNTTVNGCIEDRIEKFCCKKSIFNDKKFVKRNSL